MMEQKGLSGNFQEEIDFQKYWLVLKRRWLPILGIFSVSVALAMFAAVSRKPSYTAEGRLLVREDRRPSLTGLGEGFAQLERVNTQSSPLETQAQVVLSLPVMQEVIRDLDLRNDDGTLVKPEDLAAGVEVKGIAGTDVLEVSYQSDDPEFAADVVNKVIEVFIRKNVEFNRAEAKSARIFIEQQLPRTEEAVRQADLRLRRFKEQNRVVALEEESKAAVGIIARLEEDLAQSQAQLADVAARTQVLRARVGTDSATAIEYAALSQATGVQEVLKRLQEAQQNLAIARTRYRDEHPQIPPLQRQVTSLENLLNERVRQVLGRNQSVQVGRLQMGAQKQELITDLVQSETELSGLARRVNVLVSTRAAYRERANVLPGLEQVQRELDRRLKAFETTYEALLTRLQEIQVAENQNIGNARIMSPAVVPSSPGGPSKSLIVGAGGILGLLLGVVAGFALDLADRSLKSLREARELLGYTLLGVIPTIKTNRLRPYSGSMEQPVPWVVARDLPRSSVLDAYQMLQANLKFLSSDKPLNSIVVTSSVAKEGKSSISANLAVAIAQVGRRVLLVDADMRRPTQHHIWDINNTTGLSNVIVGQTAFQDAVHSVMSNLDLLPSGVVPPNPLALLDSNRMAALVESMAGQYDCVIFDCPPLAGTADAAVLGKLADGILLVVRPGVVNSGSASAAKEFLKQYGQNVLGMVVNGVSVNSEPDGYFFYSGETSDADFSLPQFTSTRR